MSPSLPPRDSGPSSDSSRDAFLSDAAPDASGTFDLEKFYISSTDKKGRQTTLRLHVPPSLLRQIQEVVAKRIIPEYRTTHDVLRDFLVVGANMRLEQIDEPGFARDTELLTINAHIETMMAQAEFEVMLVENAEKMTRIADSDDERERVRGYIHSVVGNLQSKDRRARLERLLQ